MWRLPIVWISARSDALVAFRGVNCQRVATFWTATCQVVVVAMTAAAVLQVAAAVASAAQVGVEVEAAATVHPKADSHGTLYRGRRLRRHKGRIFDEYGVANVENG